MIRVICQTAGALAVAVALVLACDLRWRGGTHDAGVALRACEVRSSALALSFRTWAQEHHDEFPFNVSTNEGGTREFCDLDSDGFDRNAWLHFQVLSNEIFYPVHLVCAGDTKHKPASNFQSLGPENMPYRLRSGQDLTNNAKEILFACPVHSTVTLCTGDSTFWGPPVLNRWRYTTTFGQGVVQILISLGAGAFFIWLAKTFKRADKHT